VPPPPHLTPDGICVIIFQIMGKKKLGFKRKGWTRANRDSGSAFQPAARKVSRHDKSPRRPEHQQLGSGLVFSSGAAQIVICAEPVEMPRGYELDEQEIPDAFTRIPRALYQSLDNPDDSNQQDLSPCPHLRSTRSHPPLSWGTQLRLRASASEDKVDPKALRRMADKIEVSP
jgi:hypothetical protein